MISDFEVVLILIEYKGSLPSIPYFVLYMFFCLDRNTIKKTKENSERLCEV